jgi:protein TonB
MPPAALALAILLHILAGLAIWWLSPPAPTEPDDQPVMIMFDTSPSNVGLQAPEKAGPPAESTAASPQPSAEPQREEQRQALAPSRAQPPPEQVPSLPLFEFSVPPPPEPPPAPTSRDFSKPPAPRPPLRPVLRTQPLAPRPAPQRPPAEAPATMPSPMPGLDPGDVLIGQGRQRNDYLTRVFRHLEPYRMSARASHASTERGRVVTRVTIGRDGGLIDVRIDSSSGRPAIDAAELEAIRRAAPFPPVPSAMPGDPVILVLRMTY